MNKVNGFRIYNRVTGERHEGTVFSMSAAMAMCGQRGAGWVFASVN